MNNINTFYVVKSADICYITLLYLMTAYVLAQINDNIFVAIYGNDHSKKSKNQLLLEIVIQVSLSGVYSYIGRNFIMEIPSPLHGINNFDHYKVKELNSGAILLMFLIIFQKNLQKKINLLREMP